MTGVDGGGRRPRPVQDAFAATGSNCLPLERRLGERDHGHGWGVPPGAPEELRGRDSTPAPAPWHVGWFAGRVAARACCKVGMRRYGCARPKRTFRHNSIPGSALPTHRSPRAGGIFCGDRRGEWWNRLSVDLEHQGRVEEALTVTEAGLEDEWLSQGQLLTLRRRYLRLGARRVGSRDNRSMWPGSTPGVALCPAISLRSRGPRRHPTGGGMARPRTRHASDSPRTQPSHRGAGNGRTGPRR